MTYDEFFDKVLSEGFFVLCFPSHCRPSTVLRDAFSALSLGLVRWGTYKTLTKVDYGFKTPFFRAEKACRLVRARAVRGA